jgi:hypothetical protein
MMRLKRWDEPMFRQLSIAGKGYTITKLDLVSLLKHKTAVAYISRIGGLTRKNYKKAKTRPLTRFETGALSKLMKGFSSAFNGDTKRPALLGAIRAGKGCLSCHHVSKGELLGAFTYQLRPVRREERGERREGRGERLRKSIHRNDPLPA